MKASHLLTAAAVCISFVVAPQIVVAGIGGENGAVPEPTALLVWAGLAGIGGLFFWRRQRDSD